VNDRENETGTPPSSALAAVMRGEPSISTTVCPRSRNARATRPSPAPMFIVNRPGAGTSSKKRSPWNRWNESCPEERVHRIQSSALLSHARRSDTAGSLL
jgi:hypothetical protein